jgi:hypothetical protein
LAQFLQHYPRRMPEITATTLPGRAEFSTALHVVVTCSDRKKSPVPAPLRLSTVLHQRTRARARTWIARLQSCEVPTLPARLLYAGDHWQVARSLAAGAVGRMELWVASAGYGLIREDQPIKPYSATFSPSGPDSVTSQAQAQDRNVILREWWAALAEWELSGSGTPRSVQTLAARHPEAILLVALSNSYLRALRDDLIGARDELRSSGRLIIVSAGTKSQLGLEENLLPVGAEVQSALGGSRLSLNVRIVRHLIQTWSQHTWEPDLATAEVRALRRADGQRVRRTQLSDREVLDFIARARREAAGVSWSALLRRLRDHGFACEQLRFRELFVRARLQ